MNKLLIVMALFLLGWQSHVMAQSNDLKIYTNSTTSTYPLASIDSIVYEDACADLVFQTSYVLGQGLAVAARGGTAPYAYSLDSLTWQSSAQFPSVLGSTVSVWVRDANNCMLRKDMERVEFHLTFVNGLGQALPNVNINYADITASMGGSTATILDYYMAEGRNILHFTCANHMSKTLVVDPSKGAIQYATVMLDAADQVQQFAQSTGGTLTLNSGAAVQIPANGVTLMDGSVYTGTQVEVQVQELNQDKGLAFSSLIPGATLSAVDANGDAQELYSYGMLNVELYGDNGEPLQLKSGSQASLTFVIATVDQATAPATIPLWYFDEEAGLWKEEGVATKQGNTYVGAVSHFTTWNVDQPHPPCTISGCLEDSLGNPVVGLSLQVGQLSVSTGDDGCFTVLVPAQFLPIDVSIVDYNVMTSCLLHSLSTVISPSANYNLGTLTYVDSCNQVWDIHVPSNVVGVLGDTLSVGISVKNMGNGLSGVQIRANVLQGGGSVVSSQVSTDGQGLASVDWILGTGGVQELKVYVGSQRYIVSADTLVMGTMTDGRDGNVYATVTYPNGQRWMAENLRYDVPGVITAGNVVDTINPNNPSTIYGRLYDWNTVMASAASSNAVPSGVQGICPNGWHVPSDEEWKLLEKSLGMSPADADNNGWRGPNQGMQMKSTSGWNSHNGGQSGNGSNNSGFNAFPAGNYLSGSFSPLGYDAYFWSSTENSSSTAWIRDLHTSTSEVFRAYYNKTNGFPCRCLEN